MLKQEKQEVIKVVHTHTRQSIMLKKPLSQQQVHQIQKQPEDVKNNLI